MFGMAGIVLWGNIVHWRSRFIICNALSGYRFISNMDSIMHVDVTANLAGERLMKVLFQVGSQAKPKEAIVQNYCYLGHFVIDAINIC